MSFENTRVLHLNLNLVNDALRLGHRTPSPDRSTDSAEVLSPCQLFLSLCDNNPAIYLRAHSWLADEEVQEKENMHFRHLINLICNIHANETGDWYTYGSVQDMPSLPPMDLLEAWYNDWRAASKQATSETAFTATSLQQRLRTPESRYETPCMIEHRRRRRATARRPCNNAHPISRRTRSKHCLEKRSIDQITKGTKRKGRTL